MFLPDFVKKYIKADEEEFVLTNQLRSNSDPYDFPEDEIAGNISSYRAFARQRALLLQSLRESTNLLSSYYRSLRDAEPNRLNVKSIMIQRFYRYIVRALIRIL